MSQLRNRKVAFLGMVRVHAKRKDISVPEAAKWEEMFRKCRTQEAQGQVLRAFHAFIDHWRTGTDVNSILIRGDLLDDPETDD